MSNHMGPLMEIDALEPRRFFNVALDASFADAGALDLGELQVSAVAVQRDGKILVAGTDLSGAFVKRFLADGTPDTSFGGVSHGQAKGTPSGTVIFAGNTLFNQISQIAARTDGEIVIAGGANDHGELAELTSHGQLNGGFGGPANGFASSPAGMLSYSIDTDLNTVDSASIFTHLALASDGHIAVTGPTRVEQDGAGDREFGSDQLLVFNGEGKLDSTFAKNGVYTLTYGASGDPDLSSFTKTYEAVAFDLNSRPVVAEVDIESPEDSSGTTTLSVVRFDKTGTPTGQAELEHESKQIVDGGLSQGGSALTLLQDGSFLLLSDQVKTDAVYHLNNDLTKDTTFAGGAAKTSLILIKGTPERSSLSVLSDGRFYVSAVDAQGQVSNIGNAIVERYLPDGTVDPTFGASVVVATGIDSRNKQPTGPIAQFAAVSGDDLMMLTSEATYDEQKNGSFFQSQEGLLRKLAGGGRASLSAKGTLLLAGTSGDDQISIRRRKSDGRLVAQIGDLVQSFSATRVKRISVYGYGGDDTITVGSSVRGIFADGGDGKDTLTGGDGADTLNGGLGADKIFGGAGDDSLNGGGRNDSLFGDIGNDTLAGNGGQDTLSGAAGNDLLLGGPGSADLIQGGSGKDSAASDPLDTYSSVEIRLK